MVAVLCEASAGSVPVVDVGPLFGRDAGAFARTARELRRVFETVGFAYIAGHGVKPELIEALFAASRQFHALPIEAKMRVKMNAQHRGYMPFSTSTIVTSSVARVTKPNQSESFMMMHEVSPDDPDVVAGKPLQGPNQWPEELPDFKPTLIGYEAAARRVGETLARAIAVSFDLPAEWFAPHFAKPTTWLRLLHYPPLPDPLPPDLFSSAPHTDYGFLTILAQDDTGGLEVRGRDGSWIPAPPIKGTYVVNVADVLMQWTNGILVSTPHRVRNVAGRDRYSCPYFYDPGIDTVVECLPGIVKPGESPRWPATSWRDYVMERLDKNYVYRQRPQA
ncbi:MAG: isopenicillin N synthase family oxygenase [Alphaproteobacteria bacterium]|nr:isopenicillin N synthase family oxygenase [Alphaproteobacteria bacterium]